MNVLRTVCDLVRHGDSQLAKAKVSFGHGTDNGFDEACVLLRHVLHLPYDLDLTLHYWQAVVLDEERDTYLALLTRRIQEHLPAPYLTGWAYVQGLKLHTDPNVIVPRSLIGELLENDGLAPWLTGDVNKVLDLCTGSGAIALQAAFAFGFPNVSAVDIAPAALALADKNVALHKLDGVVDVLEGDLYVPVQGQRFDVILSNPPYVNANSMDELPLEYRNEPALALAGGQDGMDIVRRIIAGAKAHLNPQGLLVIEIGHEAAYFEAAFPDLAFTYLPVKAGEDQIVLILEQDM